MYDQNGACTTQGGAGTTTGNLQLAADRATSFTSLSSFFRHPCVTELRVVTHTLQVMFFECSPRGSSIPTQVRSPEFPKAVRSGSRPGSNIPLSKPKF